jgi:hypothetical protein
MRFINNFSRFKLLESKTWAYNELKNLVSRFDSIGIFKEEEEEAYNYIVNNGLLYEFFPEQIERHIKRYASLKSLKEENVPLYNAALSKGILTKYFPEEISMPVKRETEPTNTDIIGKNKAGEILQTLDRLDKNLDTILSRYGRQS